jgi:signal transduction histidine kinase
MYEIFERTHAAGPLSKQQFVDNYLHPQDIHDFETALKEANRPGGHFRAVCRIKRRNGSHRWLQIDGNFVEPGAGGSRFLGVIADITAGKQLERRAARISQRLATIQENERRNIAQELHDSTVQHLTAANLTLMALRPKVPMPSKTSDAWSDLEYTIDAAIKELRTFSYLLHPPALLARTLRSTLEEYVAGLANRGGLDIRLRLNVKVEKLSLPIKRSLFRIVQAALANVYRHARAAHVSVEIRWIGAGVHLTIVDNGRGFTRVVQRRPGVGIRGIKARLDEVGGRFRIRQVKPHGTMVHAVIPVEL